jgi:hypothetical protein
MDAMNSHVKSKTKNSFSALFTAVEADFPTVRFKLADIFSWSAEEKTIYYDPKADHAAWSLLHELGHMKHEHNTYSTDARLIRMEVEAWQAAKLYAKHYGQTISDEHIENCMDSYRNWQHLRSKCPICTQTGVEKKSGSYHCINCQHNWNVTTSRFCRVYRSNN